MSQVQCYACQSNQCDKTGSIDTEELINQLSGLFEHEFLKYFPEPQLFYYHCRKCDLRFFNPVIPGDGKFYSTLHDFCEQLGFESYRKTGFDFSVASRHIKPGQRVLEIGAGPGYFSNYIKEGQYLGIDISEKALEASKKNNTNVINTDHLSHCAEYTGYYDAVCHFHFIEHIMDIQLFMEKSLAALKPNGMLLLSFPCHDTYLKYVPNNLTNLPPHHLTRWSKKAVYNLMVRHNLQVCETYQSPLEDWDVYEFIMAFLYRLRSLSSNEVLLSKSKFLAWTSGLLMNPKMLGSLKYAKHWLGMFHGQSLVIAARKI
ncbi:MAG: class I SAM-dependent methyltransferase [Desulfobacteraceae bacterium]|nr:class I SAM-dependent methyltransferase [Desulfobacteraceae bacterium]